MSAAGALSARFSALSVREKGLLAAGLLCIVAFIAVKWVVMPARAEYARNRAAIPARRAVIARYDSLRQGQDRIDEELFDQVERMEKWEDGLLVGETPSAAGVFLQGVLKPFTQRPETRVTSIRALPPMKKGMYAEVAVQMEIQTSTEGLALLLADLSRQPKILRVRKLSATSGMYSMGQMQRKEVIVVSMVVAGFSGAHFDEKTAGGEGE
ncbi:MAG: type II secretion system protein GspM [Candidatus Deferrimicrobiaceae bacterium]